MENNKCVLLLSGGIDSTLVLHLLKGMDKEIYALSIDYGQKHVVELEYAKRNALKYGVIQHEIIQLDNQLFRNATTLVRNAENVNSAGSEYVPSRNLIFIAQAASFAESIGAHTIYLGCNAEDALRFPDCRKEYLDLLSETLSIQNPQHPMHLQLPLITMSKKEVITKARQVGILPEDTLSCYNPVNEKPCGACLSCQLINEASGVV